jgi:DNA-3-methyladenine glycosylase
MRRRRGGVADRQLCSGPGRLCQALAVTRDVDGAPMHRSGVVVLAPGRIAEIVATRRVGITKAADWPLRFAIAGSPWSSRPSE